MVETVPFGRRTASFGRRVRTAIGCGLVVLTVAAVSACSSSSSSGSSSAAASPSVATGRPVPIAGSEVRTLTSEQTGTSYDLYISYPEDYDTSGSQHDYPVAYVLDGQWDFKLVRSIAENGLFDGTLPSMIIVGITYSGQDPDYGALRDHDLTPFADPTVAGSGGAPDFLGFLKSEAIPYVEKNLRANPERRVLVGSSFGGLFDLYTMYTEPTLFYAYVCNSPAVLLADTAINGLDSTFAASGRPLPVRLWVSVGAVEDLHGPVLDYLTLLRGHNYQGLQLESRELDDERHAASRVEGFNRGLRYAFG